MATEHDPRSLPVAGAPLSLTISDEADALVIRPRGQIDMATVLVLKDCLTSTAEECAQPVIVDLGQVTFMDSTGLDTLLRGRRALAEKGLALTVRGVSDAVRRVFATTGTDQLLGLGD